MDWILCCILAYDKWNCRSALLTSSVIVLVCNRVELFFVPYIITGGCYVVFNIISYSLSVTCDRSMVFSCAKSVAGHEELCIDILFERTQLATAAEALSLHKYIYLI